MLYRSPATGNDIQCLFVHVQGCLKIDYDLLDVTNKKIKRWDRGTGIRNMGTSIQTLSA